MAQKVQFELVSPAKILLSEEVDMVVIPGEEGDFGVLPNHAPLISSIRPGTINVYVDGAVAERIFIAGGFAEVTPERCTVLADEAINLPALDRAAVESELKDAEAALAEGGSRAPEHGGGEAPVGDQSSRTRALQRAVAVARAKLQALESRAEH
jgi:F-type H+-transporting ATPase subunit epsilon